MLEQLKLHDHETISFGTKSYRSTSLTTRSCSEILPRSRQLTLYTDGPNLIEAFTRRYRLLFFFIYKGSVKRAIEIWIKSISRLAEIGLSREFVTPALKTSFNDTTSLLSNIGSPSIEKYDWLCHSVRSSGKFELSITSHDLISPPRARELLSWVGKRDLSVSPFSLKIVVCVYFAPV